MWKRKWPDLEKLGRGAPEPGKGGPGPFLSGHAVERRLIPSASSEPPKKLESLKTTALEADGCVFSNR